LVELSDSQLATVIGATVVLSLFALAVSVAALAGQRRVRRAYAVFTTGRRQDVLTLLERHIDEVASVRQEVAALRDYTGQLRELDRHTVSRTAMVRYDAFDDMGGHLSFSAALLDERGDGLIVTAINGRTDTRVYAKPIERGDSRHNLSDEERTAIARALRGPQREVGGRRGRRRRAPRETERPEASVPSTGEGAERS
jgi:hypothetical protein